MDAAIRSRKHGLEYARVREFRQNGRSLDIAKLKDSIATAAASPLSARVRYNPKALRLAELTKQGQAEP